MMTGADGDGVRGVVNGTDGTTVLDFVGEYNGGVDTDEIDNAEVV